MSESKEVKLESVKMDDGSIVDFPGKTRLKKSHTITEDGKVSIRLDFLNGEVRTFTIPDALLLQCAAHGALQKLGDETSGITDLEDAVEAVDTLIERLAKGEWVQKREASGMAGASVLVRALVEASGQTAAQVREFLAPKTAAEKRALRDNPKIKPIVDRLEAGKKKKVREAVDTDGMLAQIGVGVPAGDEADAAE